MLEIDQETLWTEEEVPPDEDADRGKAALTKPFKQVNSAETPIMVERVVAAINEFERLGRFPGWQGTQAGEGEPKKALKKALFRYTKMPTAISGNATDDSSRQDVFCR